MSTLLAVHAHPDDESTSTGGTLARYADLGVRTVLVTCTNGELGDSPSGAKPGQPGHDIAEVISTRRGELEQACRILGVGDSEMLGYHDSGMRDWGYRDRPDVFASRPVAEVADRIEALLLHHQPEVVITYDPENDRQHVDHLHAALATAAAVARLAAPPALFFKAHGTRYWAGIRTALGVIGVHRPEPEPAAAAFYAETERRITTSLDVSAVIDRKYAALHAHRSQIASSSAGRLPMPLFAQALNPETYIRSGATADGRLETDLFS
ncbi:GlcNAc-PI de-N-acetylase [Pseudonocardiaceae bacterium YIM PH 21723]|nr:GlcNAc-PI de-N-acetylase [Pseudonocardiaceae bacterium YIM PH 21723]